MRIQHFGLSFVTPHQDVYSALRREFEQPKSFVSIVRLIVVDGANSSLCESVETIDTREESAEDGTIVEANTTRCGRSQRPHFGVESTDAMSSLDDTPILLTISYAHDGIVISTRNDTSVRMDDNTPDTLPRTRRLRR